MCVSFAHKGLSTNRRYVPVMAYGHYFKLNHGYMGPRVIPCGQPIWPFVCTYVRTTYALKIIEKLFTFYTVNQQEKRRFFNLLDVYSNKIILSYSQWMVSHCVLPSFSIKWRYTNIEPVLNSIPIKLHRVFLSHNLVTVSSHYLIFHQHMYARQLSNRSILHAGRYLNDKEICYLGTVIVTANVCRGRL